MEIAKESWKLPDSKLNSARSAIGKYCTGISQKKSLRLDPGTFFAARQHSKANKPVRAVQIPELLCIVQLESVPILFKIKHIDVKMQFVPTVKTTAVNHNTAEDPKLSSRVFPVRTNIKQAKRTDINSVFTAIEVKRR